MNVAIDNIYVGQLVLHRILLEDCENCRFILWRTLTAYSRARYCFAETS